MKKLYIAFLLVLVVFFGGIVIYLAQEPRATVLNPVQAYEDLPRFKAEVSGVLQNHLSKAPVLMLGVVEPYHESVKLWQTLLEGENLVAQNEAKQGAETADLTSKSIEVILPDFLEPELQGLAWPESLQPVFLKASEVLERTKTRMMEGQRAIILLPSNMTSRLGDRQQTTQLQDVLGIQVTAISIVPLAVSREGLSGLPECNKEPTPSTMVSDLSCAAQYRSRFILNKRFSEKEFVGGLEQVAPGEYLLYFHFPSTSGAGAMGTSS